MAYDVFISYSSLDKPYADAACSVLERHGIRCWIAPRDILPGKSWGGAIIEAIGGARVMVLVFSRSANASPQVEREVEAAIRKAIPVLPLRIENVKPNESLEFFISVQHWLDAFTPPLEQHLERLAAVVSQILGRPPIDGRGGSERIPHIPSPPPPPPPPAPAAPHYAHGPGSGRPGMGRQISPVAPGFVMLINRVNGERKQLKTGFSLEMFFGSSFLGFPLFGVIFFVRQLYGLGGIYFAGSMVFYLTWIVGASTDSDGAGVFRGLMWLTALLASVLFGVKGNEMTAKSLLRKGWTILDDGSGSARAAKLKWGLPA